MCSYCNSMLDLPTEAINDEMIKDLNQMKKDIHDRLRTANEIEDAYRYDGVIYHTTQLSARQPDEFPSNRLAKLKEGFELTSVQEYQALFAKLHQLVQQYADLESKIAHNYSGESFAVRFHRYHTELGPTHLKLGDEFDEVERVFDTLQEDANALLRHSKTYHEHDAFGSRIAWHDKDVDEIDGQIVPLRMEDEWEAYVSWVDSLPETQRMVGARLRTLDDIALELLYSQPEEQSHWW